MGGLGRTGTYLTPSSSIYSLGGNAFLSLHQETFGSGLLVVGAVCLHHIPLLCRDHVLLLSRPFPWGGTRWEVTWRHGQVACQQSKDGDTVLVARGGTVETGLVMSTGSTSSFTLISGTGGPRTVEGVPPTGADSVGAAAMVVMGGVMGTAPGMVERAMAGWDGGLAAAIMLGMVGGGCWAVGGTATVGCSAF